MPAAALILALIVVVIVGLLLAIEKEEPQVGTAPVQAREAG